MVDLIGLDGDHHVNEVDPPCKALFTWWTSVLHGDHHVNEAYSPCKRADARTAQNIA